ncbi:MAG: ATP-binding cassette domain-containing protein [Candidatus Wallbacteria bacterium]|nr:ATP-binding cassette domain-containing protein [Candidatus Wallbacteria bacterium]
MSLLQVDKLDKTFRIRNRDKSLKRRLCNIFRRYPENTRLIKALSGVSFSLERGEVLGVIGPNGAGKTTLLKLLSGIFAPSSGSIETEGRIFSLLELGLGFYPDLSGLENIYTFAAIHGISEKTTAEKLPEIIRFSGISEFIDLPIKFYSSGMNTRLSFSILSLIEPEILLVDEIYQSGDIDFQQQSIQKINELMAKSLGVIFVSHNLHLIKSLCQRAILLIKGELVFEGPAVDTVNHYLRLSGERLHGTTD